MNLPVKCDVRFVGPFTFVAGKCCVFDQQDLITKSGIYLWPVALKDAHRVSYVGETSKSFKHLFKQHMEGYLAGVYRLHEPTMYAKGVKVLLWGGTWKKETKDNLPQFLERYLELAPKVLGKIATLRVFMATLDVETRIRRRIEGAIARVIFDYQKNSDVEFLATEDQNRLVRRGKHEPAIQLSISAPCPIEGFDSERMNQALNELPR